MDLETIFTKREKQALSLLIARGFKAFTEAKLEDVRDLAGKRQHRTFSNQGRYDLILALKKAEMPADMEPSGSPEQEKPLAVVSAVEPGDLENHQEEIEKTQVKPLEDMSYRELQAEAKKDPEAKVGGKRVDLIEMIRAYRKSKL